jgi:hypothetical protein
MEKILVIDNDGTLSKFKNCPWSDLMKNIKSYVIWVLWISWNDFERIVWEIKSSWLQLSEWFEKLYWINRKDYLYNIWKDLEPRKYIIDRWNKNLKNLLENQTYCNIMLTSAPRIWFEKTMSCLGYDLWIFRRIYTAEDFYYKKDIFQMLVDSSKFDIWNSIAIWDEEDDFIHLQNLWWTWIDVNSSPIYK